MLVVIFAGQEIVHGTRIVSLSVALLLPGVGSFTPPAAATVAVLDNVPVAAAESVPVAVNVTEPPDGKLTVALMLPDPLAGQVPPPAPTQLQVTPVSVAGNVSATVEFGALLGPALLAVMVYVTGLPAVTEVTPSVLVIARFACGDRVSLSVALLLPGTGSVTLLLTVAVLESVPVAEAEMAADTV